MSYCTAVAGFLETGINFGVPDPVGAHRRNMDAAAEECAAVMQHKGLGGRVYIQPGERLKRGRGIDLQNPGAFPHIGQNCQCHVHQYPAVQVDHAVVVFRWR